MNSLQVKNQKKMSSVRNLSSTNSSQKMDRSSSIRVNRSSSRSRSNLLLGQPSSRMLGSRRSLANADVRSERDKFGGGKVPLTVLDEDGLDVTPKPLNSKSSGGSQTRSDEANMLPDSLSFASMFQTQQGMQSMFGSRVSRSVFGNSQAPRQSVAFQSEMEGSIGDHQETEDTREGIGLSDVTTIRKEEAPEALTEHDLNKIVDVYLSETGTIWLFCQDSVSISEERPECHQIKLQNDAYLNLLDSKEGNDMFSDRFMQTITNTEKHKEVQTVKVGTNDVAVLSTTWDMHDTFGPLIPLKPEKSDEVPAVPTLRTVRRPGSILPSQVESTASAMSGEMTSQFSLISRAMSPGEGIGANWCEDSGAISNSQQKMVDGVHPQWSAVAACDSIQENLLIMERVVTQNIYQSKQASYRGLPVLIDPDRETAEAPQATEQQQAPPASPIHRSPCAPTLDRLFSYKCAATKGRNTSCVAWNPSNPDLIAVGHGPFNFNEQRQAKGGLICCWSLKNPEYPDRIYHTTASVSALDFSHQHPCLLAAGLHDGTVAVYNLFDAQERHPVLDSFDCAGKHSGAVWQLKWVDREKTVGDSNGETLVSASADGRVLEWMIRKGFEVTDLMKLKRTPLKCASNNNKKKDKVEAFISRYAPGMCIDFQPKDPVMYLVGTEEGLIHKCSLSYNEQYLDSYNGHNGCVYKVKWSPFSADIFLTCSSDWSIRLWSQHHATPVLGFLSTTKTVHDISWSPYHATVFCVVNEGAVEIWDMSVSTLDPVIIHLSQPGTVFGTCSFCQNSNCVVVGDSDGQVSIYQIRNMCTTDEKSDEAALMKIVDVALSTQFASTPTPDKSAQ